MMTKVLIVDDSSTVRQHVAVTLTDAGYDVMEAIDGEDGLAKITTTAGLAMVICDVNMPRMNGLDMLEKLKAGGGYATLPVLMLTTEGQPDLIARGKALGAKGWLVKPFKPTLLVAAVKKLTA